MQTTTEKLNEMIGSKWMTTEDIISKLGGEPKSKSSVSRALSRLIDLGRVEERTHPLNWRKRQYRKAKPKPEQGDQHER